MQAVIICVVITILLFAVAFITKRRFGLLGLALAAGSILSGIWGSTASLIVGAAGVKYSPITNGLTLSVIVLLPAIVLLFHGATYKRNITRVIGAALFTLLALAFLIDPIGNLLNLQGYGATFYQWLVSHKDLIIGGGLILAVLDLFFTKPASHAHEGKGKH